MPLAQRGRTCCYGSTSPRSGPRSPRIAVDETLTTLTADDVTDVDIHAACCAVVEQTDLSEELGAAVYRAVLNAIREAERRRTAST